MNGHRLILQDDQAFEGEIGTMNRCARWSKTFAYALMSAKADAFCGAEYGQVSDERVNHRNGYRPREWDSRAGTVELH